MITQIDHIELIVKDVKEYVDFYQKLGFKLLRWTDHHGGSAELQLPGPNSPFSRSTPSLTRKTSASTTSPSKTDDLVKTYDELKASGIEFSNEPYRNRHTGRGQCSPPGP